MTIQRHGWIICRNILYPIQFHKNTTDSALRQLSGKWVQTHTSGIRMHGRDVVADVERHDGQLIVRVSIGGEQGQSLESTRASCTPKMIRCWHNMRRRPVGSSASPCPTTYSQTFKTPRQPEQHADAQNKENEPCSGATLLEVPIHAWATQPMNQTT